MKALKYILSTIVLIAIVWGCVKKDDFGSLDFVETAIAPTDVTALFSITQDNTGLVTITPNGDGASTFSINFGDGSSKIEDIKLGENVNHEYAEGNYDVILEAKGLTGLVTDSIVPLVVSFNAPKDLVVSIINSKSVSRKIDVTVDAKFATFFEVYFGEDELADPVTANIGGTVSYTYQTEGTYTIKVIVKGGAIETTEYTEEFPVTAIMQPIAIPTDPSLRLAADVISIYGDSYATIEGTNYNPNWAQTGTYAEFDLNGDLMLQYINLTYQGIALADGTSIDITGMEFLHMDIWTADSDSIKTSLISTSGENAVKITLTSDEWTSVDIPVSSYTEQGLDASEIIQLKLDGFPPGEGTVFLDNIYFYVETPSAPVSAAPIPTTNSSVVTSIYSDSYTNVTVNEWNPGWGQTTVLETADFDGNSALKYSILDYTGIVTDYDNPTDLSDRTFVHFDYWTTDVTGLSLKLVNTVLTQEDIVAVETITPGSWVGVDFDLADFDMDKSSVTQLMFEGTGDGTIYIDNLYFYTNLADEPATGAPIPTADAADVISIFSDTYTNITSNEWNPGWGQTTVLTTVDIAGNSTLKYESLDYTGIVTNYDSPTDLSGMDYVHFDYWTNDATSLGLKLVNTVLTQEDIEAVSSITLGSWVGVDILMSDYDIADQSQITQLMFESSGATVFIDNFYFYKDGDSGGGGSSAIELPFDFETTPLTENFINFDGATVTVIDNPQSGSAKVAQLIRDGGATWAGSKIVLDDNLDFSTLGSISMKVYTDAPIGTTVKFKLEGGGGAQTEVDALTTTTGAWETLTWSFTGAASNTYNTLVFMFDFGNVGDGSASSTFILDDVTQVDLSNGLSQIDLPLDFESSTVDYTMTDFGGNASSLIEDPNNSSNMIIQVIKSGSAETWAGTTIGTNAGFASYIPISLTDSKITIRVWSEVPGTPIRLKIEDFNDNTHTCEAEVNTTLTGAWETMEFDFTNQATGTELLSVGLDAGWVYNKASIFFNFGTSGATAGEKTYYFDDVVHIN